MRQMLINSYCLCGHRKCAKIPWKNIHLNIEMPVSNNREEARRKERGSLVREVH